MSELEPWIVLLVPILYVILETLKRVGRVPAKWIPLVNALLSLFAGGGAALLTNQDLPAAVTQIVILFLATAGVHDRLKGLLARLWPGASLPVEIPEANDGAGRN